MNFLIAFTILFTSLLAHTHEGPAFPILVDQKLKSYTVSVWADPDTGNGTYNLYFKPVDDSITEITLLSFPKRNPLHKISGVTKKLAASSCQQNYVAVVPFDSEETWETEFLVKQKDGSAEKVLVSVDVTPPGPSKAEFAIYFLPFLLIAFVWGKAYFQKRK